MASIIEKRTSRTTEINALRSQNKALRQGLLELQPLARLGSTTSMIAHEMNNLLAPVISYAQLALKNPSDGDLSTKAHHKALANAERACEILRSMLRLAGGAQSHKTTTAFAKLLKRVFTAIGRDFSKDGITVRADFPREFAIKGVAVQLEQVLMNLVLNAREAMLGRGGVLSIGAGRDGSGAWITVSDTGDGIDLADAQSVFEPFYTTKLEPSGSSRRGTGLGLAFCREVVEAHGGIIRVDSPPGGPTVFRVILPDG